MSAGVDQRWFHLGFHSMAENLRGLRQPPRRCRGVISAGCCTAAGGGGGGGDHFSGKLEKLPLHLASWQY
jgi:hypothetical protein